MNSPGNIFRKIVAFIKEQGSFCLALFLVIALPFLWFLPQRGLTAMYYNNPEWKAEPVFSQLEKEITLKIAKQRRGTFPQENFSVTWSGWIRIDKAGEYSFATLSDDGSSLFIDNAVVVDNGGFHAPKKVSGKVFLTQGMHSIIINCFQGEGTYKLKVVWTEPGRTETEIPLYLLYSRPFPIKGIEFLPRNMGILYTLSCVFLLVVIGRRKIRNKGDFAQILGTLIGFIKKQGLFYLALLLILFLPFLWFLPPRGLTGAYYDNQEWGGEPIFSQRETQINLETVTQPYPTSTSAFSPELAEGSGQASQEGSDMFPQRNFSVLWTGWISVDREGEYTFFLESDDGSSLFIDDVRVVKNDGVHVARKVSGRISLTRGLHPIRINYFQGGGAYKLQVSWQEPGKAETAIPHHHLYPQLFSVPGISFLSRNLGILYPLSWLFLILVVVGRRMMRERDNLTGVIKGYVQNIFLTLITILVFVLVAEGVVRLVLYIREDRRDVKLLLKESKEADFEGGPRTYSLKGIVQESPYENIVYELKPSLKGNFRGAPLTTNSRGLRDFEYSYRKPENTFRIVGLGDSSLFGWGVRMEDTSMKVLGRKLNQLQNKFRTPDRQNKFRTPDASSTNYEVLNFAAPGYNTAIEVEVFLKKCLKYSPDLVIVHFNTNDYDVPGFMRPPQSYSTLKKSYFLNFLYSRFQLLWGEQQQEMLPFVVDRTMTLEESDRLDEDPAFPDEYRHMVGKKGFLRAIDKLVRATKSHGIPLVVYVVKSHPGLDPSYTPNPFRDNQLRLITQLSKEKGFFLLNMYAAYINYLKEHPDKDRKMFWVSEVDSHPSAVAHQIEAEALYNFLIKNSLIRNSNE